MRLSELLFIVKMDEGIEREEIIALNPDKERKQQMKEKWKIFSGCYKISIAFVVGVLCSALLIR